MGRSPTTAFHGELTEISPGCNTAIGPKKKNEKKTKKKIQKKKKKIQEKELYAVASDSSREAGQSTRRGNRI
jgi:hypothetical protein